MSSYKKPKVADLSEAERTAQRKVITTVLTCAGHSMTVLMAMDDLWPLADNDSLRLDLCLNAYSAFMTYHKAMCQNKNGGNGSIKEQIADGKTFKVRNTELEWKEAKLLLAEVYKIYKMDYADTKIGSTDNWISVSNSYLNTFLGFKHRINEVHMGRSKWSAGEGEGQPKRTAISYGIEPKHEVLCEGITYPPYMKSPLLSSLGPGALLAYYMDNKEKKETKYKQKILREIRSCLSTVPKIDDIIEVMEESNLGTVKGITNSLLGFLLTSGFRCKNRAYFPPSVLVMTQTKFKPLNNRIDDAFTIATTGGAFDLHAAVKGMDLTGAGMWTLYHSITPLMMKYGKFANEILTHAILGTDKENLSLLETVTGHHFSTRNEMGDAFKAKTKQADVLGAPVPFKFVCKLSTANATPGLYPTNQSITNMVVLGGKRKYFESDAMKDFLNDLNQGNRTTTLPNLAAVQAFLVEETLRVNYEVKQRGERGTNEWYAVNSHTKSYKNRSGVLEKVVDPEAAEGERLFHA